DSNGPAAGVDPAIPASDETNRRLFPEMRRPKPNQEAIAAALQAMQRLTMKMDSETAVEETTPQTLLSSSAACPACGHQNRQGNKFCGMCGLPIDSAGEQPHAGLPTAEPPALDSPEATIASLVRELTQTPLAASQEVHPPEGTASGTHHYHHHYHHHYFQGGMEGAVAAPMRGMAPESAREADRLRIAAAAKGEPMSRNEAAVRRLTQEWVLACNTRQLDELIDLYSPDALVLRSNLPLLRGAAAVREFFYSALEAGLGEVEVEPIRVEVIGDLAHEVGRYSALVPGTTGKRREERGKYLWVFAKQSGGEWKLASECWSSDLTLNNAESDLPKAAIPSSASKGQLRRS
ncbi:MAG: SgcJ/EcaC family oxidoreductase, partial [Candidatus Sulfotelmatobacter sp.]